MKPTLLVIAGPNGSGKTTVTTRLREDHWSDGVEYLNPDEIARDRFGDWNDLVGTVDPRINAARVAGRVMAGGHTVPIEKIVRRYVGSMANLSPLIRVCDRVYVYDNSVDDVEARLCARTEDGQLRKIYGALPDWVGEAVLLLGRNPQFVDARAP